MTSCCTPSVSMSARRAAPSGWPGRAMLRSRNELAASCSLRSDCQAWFTAARALRHALLEGGDRAVVLVVELRREVRLHRVVAHLAWESEEIRSWVTARGSVRLHSDSLGSRPIVPDGPRRGTGVGRSSRREAVDRAQGGEDAPPERGDREGADAAEHDRRPRVRAAGRPRPTRTRRARSTRR